MKHHPAKKVTSSRHQPKDELSFSAKDFPHHAKNHLWYIGIGILLLALLILLYQTSQYQLMILTLAGALAVFRLAAIEPRSHQVKVNDRGVYWGDQLYPYFQLKSFWVAGVENNPTIYIERLNLAPALHFIVPESKLVDLVTTLAENLPFHAHKNEPLGDKLNRLMRF